MVGLTRTMVDAAIGKIAAHLPAFRVPEQLLVRFSNSGTDRMYRDYLTSNESGYLRFLPMLIQQLELKSIVELGNREGMSTLCLFSTLAADGRLVTVDIVRDQRFCPEHMFSDSRVRFVQGDVADLAIYGNEVPIEIELLFSDTIHFDRQLRDELAIYGPLLADRALVAIDDINLNDKRKWFDEVPYPKWDLTTLCHGSGFGLTLFERKEPISKEVRLAQAYAASAQVWKRRHDEVRQAPMRAAVRGVLVKQPKLRRIAGRLFPRGVTGVIKQALRME